MQRKASNPRREKTPAAIVVRIFAYLPILRAML